MNRGRREPQKRGLKANSQTSKKPNGGVTTERGEMKEEHIKFEMSIRPPAGNVE